jgi:uncharacterized protein with von Willebrand factor type A (vWA) domain
MSTRGKDRQDGGDRRPLGGLIHTYQRFDPKNFPSPTARPPDLASAAFEHMLAFGSTRRLTPEELARAVKIDPSQIAGLGPSLEALMEMLRERKRRILATYEAETVQKEAGKAYELAGRGAQPPANLRGAFHKAIEGEQIGDLEKLWYKAGDEQSPFAMALMRLMEQLGEKYQVEELAAKYVFTGRTGMDVPKALEVKEELEAIDRLLEQLKEAAKNARIGIIDMEELARFAQQSDMEQLTAMQQQLQDYLKEQAERQGLEFTREGYQLTPEAYRIFQGKLLQEIFADLQAARSGRHSGPIAGEGAVELPRTKPYEFGDSVGNMDVGQSFVNAAIRRAGWTEKWQSGPVAKWQRGTETGLASPPGRSATLSLLPEDIEIHRTRNSPKCATVVLLDMSGSMRYDGQYVNCKRMALALDGLIRREYPGDYLKFIEMYTFARLRAVSELPSLMPKPVTIHSPMVRLKVDMSKEDVAEFQIPHHFTNIQRSLQLARQLLGAQDTPNRQVILITDGLPTAHFEGSWLYLMYPPDPRTEEATMREGMACKRDGITINLFLLPNWAQSSEDVNFAHKLAEGTGGRVFFTAGSDIDRYVLWDYVGRRRKIIG